MHRMQSGGWPFSKVGRDSCMLTCDYMHASCMHVTWMLHEHACVLQQFALTLQNVNQKAVHMNIIMW